MGVGHMNFFEVNECGLYRNQDTDTHGLEMAETFAAIYGWVGALDFQDTLPWFNRPGSPKMYCRDVYHDEDKTGDYLFVLWKSDTDSTGSLWGAPLDQSIGKGQVVKLGDRVRGTKMAWGRPCYYWVIPSEDTVISIKFENSVCDSFLFQDWVSACITNKVEYPNKRKEKTEAGHIRLSFTDGTESEALRFRYGFNVSLRTLATGTSALGELAKKVTHLVRRETVKLPTIKDDSAQWLKWFSKDIPFLKSKDETRKIEISAEARPSVAEMREIIGRHARQDRKRNDWDRVGFKTDDGITWVDTYRVRSSVEAVPKSGIFGAAELYDVLAEERDSCLAALKGVRSRHVA
jgi:hypothetical protein